MNRLEKLKTQVIELYEKKDPNRDSWADWLYLNHVFAVTSFAGELAKKFGADSELAQAAAMLHDIADVERPRADTKHEGRSKEIAKDLLQQDGYSAKEIQTIVDDAIEYHSCSNKKPESLEGKVLATADSLAHLTTDFYAFAAWSMGSKQSYEETKAWAAKKIERDFNDKILFEEVKSELLPQYKILKGLFS